MAGATGRRAVSRPRKWPTPAIWRSVPPTGFVTRDGRSEADQRRKLELIADVATRWWCLRCKSDGSQWSGSAISRAQSMNSRAAGLGERPLKATIPIGRALGSSTGSFLMKGCRTGNCSQNSGMIER